MGQQAKGDRGTRPKTLGDAIIAIAVSVLGLGNLALPEAAQEVAGIDYLLLCMGALAVMFLVRLSVSIKRPSVWLVAFLIAFSALPGFVAGGIGDYGQQKLQTVLIMAVSLVALGALRRPTFGVKIYILIGATLAVLFASLLFTVSVTAENGRSSVLGLNPVGVARLTALGATIFLVYLLASRKNTAVRLVVFIALAVFCAAATFVTGSRGPLVAALGAVAVALLASLRTRRAAILLVLGALIAIPLAVALGGIDLDEGLAWSSGRQDSGRFVLYGAAVKQTLTEPLGLGWGNFGQLFGWSSGSFYPHNIFLEVAVEGGLFALVGFATVICMAFFWSVRSYRCSGSRSDLLILAVYSYSVINAQFSSDLVGNRMLWISMAFVVAVRAYRLERQRQKLVASEFKAA